MVVEVSTKDDGRPSPPALISDSGVMFVAGEVTLSEEDMITDDVFQWFVVAAWPVCMRDLRCCSLGNKATCGSKISAAFAIKHSLEAFHLENVLFVEQYQHHKLENMDEVKLTICARSIMVSGKSLMTASFRGIPQVSTPMVVLPQASHCFEVKIHERLYSVFNMVNVQGIEHEANMAAMLKGELYYAFTPELTAMRDRCHQACHRFNVAGDAPREKLIELWREYVSACGVWREYRKFHWLIRLSQCHTT